MMATISLCMIVRNEEDVLGRCLDCVKDICDEIIIADTGSTDATKEIAGTYTDKVYDFPWRDDFAAARNFSFSKATMDYILWLDADDVLDAQGQNALQNLKQDLRADVVMLPYHVAFDENERPTFSYYRERILRRDRHFQWKGAVHEAITPSGNILYGNAAVLHKKTHVSDLDRNLRILEKQIKNGIPLEPRMQFYYARELFYHGMYSQAIAAFEAFLSAKGTWKENCIDACMQLSECYAAIGKPQDALQSLLRSFQYDLPRAECCCAIGKCKISEQKYDEAAYWYKAALNAPNTSESGGFFKADCYDYIPYMQLCVCYDRMGNVRLAKAYNEKAGRIKPNDPAYLWNKKYFQEKQK